MAFEDLTGKKYEKLTVLAYHGLHLTPGGTARHLWKCRCDCGAIKIVQGVNLKNGSTKSCGCWELKFVGDRFKELLETDVVAVFKMLKAAYDVLTEWKEGREVTE